MKTELKILKAKVFLNVLRFFSESNLNVVYQMPPTPPADHNNNNNNNNNRPTDK
jgi:hypothetical protein